MPLSTFLNLPEARQAEIRDVAFKEFALNDYQNASVSNIVKNLKISKGGFYRYFKNKMDLYQYLMEEATQMRLKNVHELFSQTDDFYEMLVQNFAMKIKFDLAYPVIGQFLYNTMQERNSAELGDLLLQTKERIMMLTKMMLVQFQKSGNLRSDLDPDIIAFAVVQIQMGVLDFLAIKHKVNPRKTIQQDNLLPIISEAVILDTVKAFSEILRGGLKPATD